MLGFHYLQAEKTWMACYSNDFHNITVFGKIADELCSEGRKGYDLLG